MHTEYLPKLLPTMIDEGQGPGVQFRTDGELVPALTMELDGSMTVYFEHHIVLWKTPSLEIGLHPMKGAFKRAIAGMSIFMTECKGAGQIAFSRDGVGHVFHLPLAQGQTINAITFMSGAQAEATGTHLWYAIYRADTLALLAQSTDNTGAAAFGASLSFRQALTAPVVLPYTGLYYLGINVTASTVPTLLNLTSGVTTNLGAVASTAPILAATSTGSLTAAAPNPAGALTTIVQCLWAGVD